MVPATSSSVANNVTVNAAMNVASFYTSGIDGTLTLNGAVTSSSPNTVQLGGRELFVNAPITTTNGGNVILNMTDNITFTALGDIYSDGDVYITAGGFINSAGDIITTNDDIYMRGFLNLTGDVTYSGKTFWLNGQLQANGFDMNFKEFKFAPVFPPYQTALIQAQEFPGYDSAVLNTYYLNAYAPTQLLNNAPGLQLATLLNLFQAEERFNPLLDTVIFGDGNTFVYPESESTCLEDACTIENASSDLDFIFDTASVVNDSEELISKASMPAIKPIF